MKCVIQGKEVDLVIGDTVQMPTYNWMGESIQKGTILEVDDRPYYESVVVRGQDNVVRHVGIGQLIAKLAN